MLCASCWVTRAPPSSLRTGRIPKSACPAPCPRSAWSLTTPLQPGRDILPAATCRTAARFSFRTGAKRNFYKRSELRGHAGAPGPMFMGTTKCADEGCCTVPGTSAPCCCARPRPRQQALCEFRATAVHRRAHDACIRTHHRVVRRYHHHGRVAQNAGLPVRVILHAALLSMRAIRVFVHIGARVRRRERRGLVLRGGIRRRAHLRLGHDHDLCGAYGPCARVSLSLLHWRAHPDWAGPAQRGGERAGGAPPPCVWSSIWSRPRAAAGGRAAEATPTCRSSPSAPRTRASPERPARTVS